MRASHIFTLYFIAAVTFFNASLLTAQTIVTVAGGLGQEESGSRVLDPAGLAVDPSGNLFIAAGNNQSVFRVDALTGDITQVAGNLSFVAGFGGDGGPANNAKLLRPSGVAFDGMGNLYIADQGNERIRFVDAITGIITTVVGNGEAGFNGDGLPATSAKLNSPFGLAVDGSGDLFIADQGNHRIRRVNWSTGKITTVAGNGIKGYGGDGGPATLAQLNDPTGVAVDATGNLFIADQGNHRVRRVDVSTGEISTYAGTGIFGFSGDGGAAASGQLNVPTGVFVDGSGNLFISDRRNQRIRMVDASTGVISTIAGNGIRGYSGDNGPASLAMLYNPSGLVVDGSGNIFIGDQSNGHIRRVDKATMVISTLPGFGVYGFSGDGGAATSARLYWPFDVDIDHSGNIFIADRSNQRIRRVDGLTGEIVTVAGNGGIGYNGDGQPATSAQLNYPAGVSVDGSGNIFIVDAYNQRIRKVDVFTGEISTVAGNGLVGTSGDGGPATDARLINPNDIVVDRSGNLFISDQSNRIRRVDASDGIINTVAGTGESGFSGDGGPAIAAQLYDPTGLVLDMLGNLYFADRRNHCVRRVDGLTGIISTVAGTGNPGFSGDGGPATSAMLYDPNGVALDGIGNLYITEHGSNQGSGLGSRIRHVDLSTGVINTVAGNGIHGFSGDGGLATSARLFRPSGADVDEKGNLFFADRNNHRIRKVTDPKPPYTKRTIYRSESAQDQEVPEGLILWNTLDSKEEVANSVWGPDIQQTTHKIPRWGEARIESANFSNGLFINHDINAGDNDGANFFAIDNHEMGMSVERGTIEFLIKFEEDYTLDNNGHLFVMHQILSGHFTEEEFFNRTGVKFQLVWDGRPDIYRYLMSAAYQDQWFNGWTDAELNDNVKFTKGEIAHFAFVWDVNGIQGGTTTAYLYINGIREAKIDVPWPTEPMVRKYTYLGITPGMKDFDHQWNAFVGVMDNIKIWDRPLYQQEFIDNAKSFEGFVEWPEGPVFVDDGDISPEKLGYPKVWTLCEGSISYEYEDIRSSEPRDIGDYTNAVNIERYWTIKTDCGEYAMVIQDIYLVDPLMSIKSFSVIDPRSDEVIDELAPGSNTYRTLGGNEPWRINIRANTNPETVGSVKFRVNGKWERNENVPPYALGGDRNGDYFKWDVSNMVYFICATPYSEANGRGDDGETSCINLTLIFTLPEMMEGSGSIRASKGHNSLDPMSEGYVHYNYETHFDHRHEEFLGVLNVDLPSEIPDVDYMSGPIYWYQRTTNAYFLFQALKDGSREYYVSLRLIFRPNKTLARLIIFRDFNDIILDTQMGDPYYTPPTETAENAENHISDPPLMPGYMFYRRSIPDELPVDILADHLAVYPNPFGEMIQVVLPYYDDTSDIQVKLIDTQGRVILEQNLATGREHTIDTFYLGRGVYLLQLDLPDGQRAVRLVK